MIGVTQTRTAPGEGNCFAASLASILNLPLEAVPDVMHLVDWWTPIVDWLNERGLAPLRVAYPRVHYASNVLCVAEGMGPRGALHSVVWRGSECVFDPHPSRAGLVGDPRMLLFLVKLDPGAGQ